jgi:hypothetical protein
MALGNNIYIHKAMRLFTYLFPHLTMPALFLSVLMDKVLENKKIINKNIVLDTQADWPDSNCGDCGVS